MWCQIERICVSSQLLKSLSQLSQWELEVTYLSLLIFLDAPQQALASRLVQNTHVPSITLVHCPATRTKSRFFLRNLRFLPAGGLTLLTRSLRQAYNKAVRLDFVLMFCFCCHQCVRHCADHLEEEPEAQKCDDDSSSFQTTEDLVCLGKKVQNTSKHHDTARLDTNVSECPFIPLLRWCVTWLLLWLSKWVLLRPGLLWVVPLREFWGIIFLWSQWWTWRPAGGAAHVWQQWRLHHRVLRWRVDANGDSHDPFGPTNPWCWAGPVPAGLARSLQRGGRWGRPWRHLWTGFCCVPKWWLPGIPTPAVTRRISRLYDQGLLL